VVLSGTLFYIQVADGSSKNDGSIEMTLEKNSSSTVRHFCYRSATNLNRRRSGFVRHPTAANSIDP
jgi:hypothetical protein